MTSDYSAHLIAAQAALKRCSDAAAERDYEQAWIESARVADELMRMRRALWQLREGAAVRA